MLDLRVDRIAPMGIAPEPGDAHLDAIADVILQLRRQPATVGQRARAKAAAAELMRWATEGER